jgi:hypothetical protein
VLYSVTVSVGVGAGVESAVPVAHVSGSVLSSVVNWLAAHDFTVVTLEGALGPGETTEAMITTAETLEALAQSVFLLDPLPNRVRSVVGPAIKEMVARLNATNKHLLVIFLCWMAWKPSWNWPICVLVRLREDLPRIPWHIIGISTSLPRLNLS